MRDSSAAVRDGPAFGPLLRRLRLAIGLSQEALAERAGLSARGVSDLERGARRMPHPGTIARLAEALGLDAGARARLFAASRPDAGNEPVEAPAEPAATGLPSPAATSWLSPLTSFVGREAELGEIRRLLERTRLLTLAGAGGIGKTRLALETARAVVDEGALRCAFVELASVPDALSVPQVVAAAVGVSERPGRELLDLVARTIGPQPMLLVLDNCEHLLGSCAEVAEQLLRNCPRLRVLATSREPLAIGGEVLWRVPSLRLPDPRAAGGGDGLEAESVRLFVDRAQAALPSFLLDAETRPAVAEICRRLDGIPLAIELAAARVRSLSVRQIAERLDDRFRLLVGGSRTALPRQRTLAAALEWSYQLLGPVERTLLGRLSVFAGGCELGSVESVCATPPVGAEAVLDLMTSLVDKSLVLAEALPGERAVRYRLLETIRQFAAERLEAASETSLVRDRHLAWATAFANWAAPNLVGREQLTWLRWLAIEHDNLISALEWSRTQGNAEAELELAAALGRYWHLRGPSSEGRAWLRHALAQAPRPSLARAQALNWAGRLATVNGDPDDRELLQESVALARELGAQRLLALALRHVSMAAQRHGDEAAARRAASEALDRARAAGDRREEAFGLVGLGAAAAQAGEAERAARLLDEGLLVAREVGDAGPIGWALSVLGAIAMQERRFEQAASLLEEALGLAGPMGYWAVMVASLAQLGALARAQGDVAGARRHAQACLVAAQDSGDSGLMAAALGFYAELEMGAGQLEDAVRLLGAEHAWRSALGAHRFVSFWSWPAPNPEQARADLGEQTFARAWDAGQRMSLEAAVSEALATTR